MIAVYLFRLPTLKTFAKWKQDRTKKIFIGCEVAIIVACVFLAWASWSGPEKVLRGFLIPDSEPTPENNCSFAPESAVFLVYGDSAGWTTFPPNTPMRLITFAGEEVLTFESTSSGGVLVNAIIRDEKGTEVATINRNVFSVKYGSEYDATSPDAHSVLGLNNKNEVVLSVRYLNPRAIKILGVFHEPNRRPLIIDDNGIRGAANMSRICMGNFYGGLSIE